MLIQHTQCSVNTSGTMSICMKSFGVKNHCLYEMAAVLTFLIFPASDENDVCSFTDSAAMSCHSFDETA